MCPKKSISFNRSKLILKIFSFLFVFAGLGVNASANEEMPIACKKQFEKIKDKTFWVDYNVYARSIMKTYFQSEPSFTSNKYYPPHDVNFKVLDYFYRSDSLFYLKVYVQDKGVMWLPANSKCDELRSHVILNFMSYEKKYRIVDLDGRNKDEEYIYEEDPDVAIVKIKSLIEKEKAKEASDRQRKIDEWKSRGGVSIGMSTEQVLRSSWGKPKKINTTTYASGVSEQWVYGNGNYLYFTNGVLTAIQN